MHPLKRAVVKSRKLRIRLFPLKKKKKKQSWGPGVQPVLSCTWQAPHRHSLFWLCRRGLEEGGHRSPGQELEGVLPSKSPPGVAVGQGGESGSRLAGRAGSSGEVGEEA